VLVESVVLALAGGALAVVMADLGVRALVALAPPELPRAHGIRVDGIVFVFAAALATLSGVVAGLIPALQVSREAAVGAMRSTPRSVTPRESTGRALVVAEVAIALVLLVGAGLVWRSLNGLLAVAPGFDQSHVLTMQVHESGRRDEPDGARAEALMRVLEAVRAVPGVNSAAFTSQLPLSGDLDAYGVELQSSPAGTPGDDGNAFRYAVTPDYFAAMRIRLRRGRLLDARDSRGGEEAILVSESFANRAFHDRDPVGQHVRFGPEMGDAHHPWDVIVGVVADVKQASLALDEPNAFYVGINQWAWVDNVESLVVRTTGDAAALAPAVRQAIWTADSHRALARVTTMDALVAGSEGERAFALVMLEAFAIAALLLAAVGTYGVLAGNVAERTREIGVRAALGASPGDLLGLIVGEGLTLTGVGVVFGLGGAALASQAVTTLLFGVSRLDVVTYSVVIAILGLVSVVACAVPARRAARIDPLVVLRLE